MFKNDMTLEMWKNLPTKVRFFGIWLKITELIYQDECS